MASSHSFNDLYKHAQKRDNIIHKLADGTEGTMTMVGALESLDKPLVLFSRWSSDINWSKKVASFSIENNFVL